VAERNHGEHGPEDLFLRDTHGIVRAREHRRLYVVAALLCRAAADRNLDALAARHAEVAEHLFDVRGMDQRPELRIGIERMTDLDLAYALDEALREFVLDGLLHEQPARRRAALAVQAVDH